MELNVSIMTKNQCIDILTYANPTIIYPNYRLELELAGFFSIKLNIFTHKMSFSKNMKFLIFCYCK